MITLQELRKAAGLSQEELGEKVGLTQQAIGHYESGLRMPNIEVVKKMACILGCNWWELFEDAKKTNERV